MAALLCSALLLTRGVQALRADALRTQADAQTADLNLDAALTLSRQATRLTPDDPAAFLALGQSTRTLWHLRRRDDLRTAAVAAYERAAALSPADPQALYEQARMYSFARRYPEAVRLLGRALERDPNNAGLVLELARDQEQAGRLDASRASYRRCLTLDAVPECDRSLERLTSGAGVPVPVPQETK